MKTILQYYHALPEPYCSQAIEAGRMNNVNMDITAKYIQEALKHFNFQKTYGK